MNERDDEANVPRAPWKRLLEDAGDGPPETTDARIRAAARRDLAPRGHRWWLPASLAASFVLAVLIVRSEIGTGGRAPIFATERGGDEAMDARIIDRNKGEQAREPGQAPAAAPRRADKQRAEAESDEYGYQDFEPGEEAAGTGPLVGGPERELKAASELPEERVAPIDVPTAAAELPNAATRAPAPAAAAPDARPGKALGAVAAAPPTPEAWYAAIEKLRREGKTAEADRELERLKKAWPGWLEKHLQQQPPPP